MSIYWPGTNVIKSNGNAFDWRNKPSLWANPSHAERASIISKMTAKPGMAITINGKSASRKPK